MASLAHKSLNICSRPAGQIVMKRFQCSGNPANHLLNKKIPGLSSRVVSVPATEVGPGASKNSAYKNPEYFCYDQSSYFEAEIELSRYRLPQPSNKK